MTMKIVRHGVVMIKLNSNLVNIFDIFNVSISGINRNANTLIRYFLKIPQTLQNIDILQSPSCSVSKLFSLYEELCYQIKLALGSK